MSYEYDMAVIGAGAAGLTAAGMSALLGAKTVLIEANRLGGDCTWAGCIPSKTLLQASKAVHQMRTAGRFGLTPIQPEFDFSNVIDHIRQVRQHIYDDSDAPSQIEKLGVEVILGSARFCDPHTLQIRKACGHLHRLTSRFFVIAAGSRPKEPAFSEPVLTNETIFEQRSQPKRLLIMGAGPVGIEMAQAFVRLGSEVTVVAHGTRALPRDDAEHASTLQECLSREGVGFLFRQRVTSLNKGHQCLSAVLEGGRTLSCDAALAAIGRQPTIEALSLENAGVAFTQQGIAVDRHCRTSKRHIYAAGDVTGKYQFTHMAEHMSKVAIMNAILRWPKALDSKHVVWSTFTEPELAHLGKSEEQLQRHNKKFTVVRFTFKKLDRAITESNTTGAIKVLADKRGRILGASILGANAGEMISEYALAMRHGLRLSHIAETIHPYPTYMLGNRRTADQFIAKQLDSPLLGLLGRFLQYRGQRKGASVL
ncbi:MAG: NAD(P)/FAD-dependent oxidoreductase [Acidobacteriaceae bacterium]|nr:NAD(P)/FAD-dependent oxidoreductase [Acidobacteriaceae bacterium]